MVDLDKIKLLSWALLEAKCMYYMPGRIHSSWHKPTSISDSLYDSLENTYKNICELCLISPTVSDMVDFNEDRACCKLVLSKLSNPRQGSSCIETVKQLVESGVIKC
jgi:hypothetical protein